MKKLVAMLLILVLVFSMSCSVFAEDIVSPEASNTPTDDTPTSPQTGETISAVWVAMIGIAAVAVLAFCGRKLISEK